MYFWCLVHENIGWKICSGTNLIQHHSTFFLKCCLILWNVGWNRHIQHFIQHKFPMLNETLGPFKSALRHYNKLKAFIFPDTIHNNESLYTGFTPSMKPNLTRWGGSSKKFHPSASTRRARRSDAAMSDQNKRIFFMLMPKTWFKVEEFRLEYPPYL